jgi:hypothetical protein
MSEWLKEHRWKPCARVVTLPGARAADNGGCEPPQPAYARLRRDSGSAGASRRPYQYGESGYRRRLSRRSAKREGGLAGGQILQRRRPVNVARISISSNPLRRIARDSVEVRTACVLHLPRAWQRKRSSTSLGASRNLLVDTPVSHLTLPAGFSGTTADKTFQRLMIAPGACMCLFISKAKTQQGDSKNT